MRFADPLLLLALLAPCLWLWRSWRAGRSLPVRRLAFPALRFLPPQSQSARVQWRRLPAGLLASGLVLSIVGLARPRRGHGLAIAGLILSILAIILLT